VRRISRSGVIGPLLLNLVNLDTEWMRAVRYTSPLIYRRGKVQKKSYNQFSLGSAAIAKYRTSANDVRFLGTKEINRSHYIAKGHAVAQLVEALRYKPEGRRFDSRWCHWNFSLT
jgi:hypothetical protein